MVDLSIPEGEVATWSVASQIQVLRRLRLGDTFFRHLTRGAAVLVLAILSGVIVPLISGSRPAIREFGLDLLIEDRWNPVTEKFGAAAPIYGTLITSFIAMLFAGITRRGNDDGSHPDCRGRGTADDAAALQSRGGRLCR